MEGDRKYRQPGYMDSAHAERKPNGNKPPSDPSAPRLPRMVQTVAATRCWNCTTALAEGVNLSAPCPKCGSALHCCKQCSYFEPSTRFQCLKPVAARIAYKDQANECGMFQARVTVARDSGVAAPPPPAPAKPRSAPVPRSGGDARAAFDKLFKK